MIREDDTCAKTIYADYQASTPIDPRIAQRLPNYFSNYFANPHADDHALGWACAQACEDAAKRIGGVIDCDADEIIFTSGATEANNLAILGLAAKRPCTRHRILVSAVEHKSVLEAARVAAIRFGCTVEQIPVDHQGCVRMEEVERRLSSTVLLVSIMAVNNEVGSLQPVTEIGRLCAAAGVVFHCDAVQALGAGPINVAALDVGALSLSSHKIYGPKGIGALYLRRDLQQAIDPLIVGGGQQRDLRSGTLPVPLCMSFADAAELMIGEAAYNERQRIRVLRDRFVNNLLTRDGNRLNGPALKDRHPGNANVSFRNRDAKDILGRLQPAIAASSGSACTSGIPEPSHVLRAMGLDLAAAGSSIRFSFGRFTTEEEVDRAAKVLFDVLDDEKPTVAEMHEMAC